MLKSTKLSIPLIAVLLMMLLFPSYSILTYLSYLFLNAFRVTHTREDFMFAFIVYSLAAGLTVIFLATSESQNTF